MNVVDYRVYRRVRIIVGCVKKLEMDWSIYRVKKEEKNI